jgi:hypothetical protein
MIVICAWCGCDMGQKEPINDVSKTHGICPPCVDKVLNRDPTNHRMVEIEVHDTWWGPVDIGGEA